MGFLLWGLLVLGVVAVVVAGNSRAGDRVSPGVRSIAAAIAGIVAVLGALVAVFLLTRGVVEILDLDRDAVPLVVGALWIALAVGGFAVARRSRS